MTGPDLGWETPPAWAEQLVADKVAGPTFLAGPDGQLGGLIPIHLKAECSMCHGPAEEIDGEDRTVIMVQVQNEPGSLFTARDYSPETDKLFRGKVPAASSTATTIPPGAPPR